MVESLGFFFLEGDEAQRVKQSDPAGFVKLMHCRLPTYIHPSGRQR